MMGNALLPAFLRELGDDLLAHDRGDFMEIDNSELDRELLYEAAAYIEMLEELVARIARAIGNCT